MADYATEMLEHLAQQMLKQQGEIDALRAERDALKAAIERVRALRPDMVTAVDALEGTLRPYAIEVMRGWIAAVDAALAVPESTEGGNSKEILSTSDAPTEETERRDVVYEIPDEDVTKATESNAPALSPASTPTGATGGVGEAQEAGE